MTIRRNVDLNAINQNLHYFETALDASEAACLYETPRSAYNRIGSTCDSLLEDMKNIGVDTCNCDGIREIEALIFDMLQRQNEGEFDELVAIGRAMYINDWSFRRAYEEVTDKLHPDNPFFKGPAAQASV